MYYEERMINGILHWRGTPDGAWHAFSDAQRRDAMRADVLMMGDRANQALTKESGQRYKFGRFAMDCYVFAAELEARQR